MPLIVITGYPLSGKTTRALELKKYFESAFKSDVVIINEENLQIDKRDAYKGLYTNFNNFPQDKGKKLNIRLCKRKNDTSLFKI